jgi:hypothetical protein
MDTLPKQQIYVYTIPKFVVNFTILQAQIFYYIEAKLQRGKKKAFSYLQSGSLMYENSPLQLYGVYGEEKRVPNIWFMACYLAVRVQVRVLLLP